MVAVMSFQRRNAAARIARRSIDGARAPPISSAYSTGAAKVSICNGFTTPCLPGRYHKGRKRHILTDTIGLPVGMIVHPADIQDRDGAPSLLARVRSSFPWLRHVFADGGYVGEKLHDALGDLGDWTIEIVKRSDVAKGFVLLPRPRPSPGQAVGGWSAPSLG
jgi:hypothetical protein